MYSSDHFKSEENHAHWMVLLREGQVRLPRNVGITDSLDFVDLMLVCQIIEKVKQIPNKLHHLLWHPCAGQLGESTQVGLCDRRPLVLVGR